MRYILCTDTDDVEFNHSCCSGDVSLKDRSEYIKPIIYSRYYTSRRSLDQIKKYNPSFLFYKTKNKKDLCSNRIRSSGTIQDIANLSFIMSLSGWKSFVGRRRRRSRARFKRRITYLLVNNNE